MERGLYNEAFKQVHNVVVHNIVNFFFFHYPLGSKSNIDRIKKSLVDKEIITIEKEGIFLADSVFELWFKREIM